MIGSAGLCTLLMLLGSLAYAAEQNRPNILLLIAEDLGPRIGSYGDPHAVTPNLDKLAQHSTRFTHVYTTAGVCAPSRAALITGQHQISFGAQHMRTSTAPLGSYLAQPPAQLRALPELLRQLGYYTYTDRKLDYQFSGIRAGSGPFTLWDQDGQRAEDWRKRPQGQPFFALINLMHTHESGVMRADGASYGPSHSATQRMRKDRGLVAKPITDPAALSLPPYYPDLLPVRADLARHYDNIHAMDQRVGEILQALQQDGLADSTVVIWTSDHGDGLPRAKRELYDSGINVPLLLHEPGQLTAATEHRLVSFVDLAPTLYAIAGGDTPPDYWHGRDFLRQQASEREYVYASRDRIDEVADRQRAVRDKRFKYIRSYHPEVPGGHPLNYRDNLDMVRAWRSAYDSGTLNAIQARWFQPAGSEQLFDLHEDPYEVTDLAGDPAHAATLSRLRQQLDEFLQRVGDTSDDTEMALRARFRPHGKQPTTPAPTARWQDNRLHLNSPIGASVGYRLGADQRWLLYTEPLVHKTVEVKSIRYGWHESPTVQLSKKN
tara:strand:+ start:5848 stop:7491 length:1644 start_codon:yes stop_codon:yes gene_type:complete